VDDEELATRRLQRLLAELDDIEIIGTASNGREAVEKINQNRPDIVFLDIQMPGMNGFDVLRNVSSVPLVIFTTAYDEYALRAFEENSIDYLFKPIEKTRLVQAIEKLKRLREDPRKQETLLSELKRFAQRFRMADDKTVTQKIPIKRGDATLVLDLSSVAAFVADDRLTFAWVGEKEYPVDYTLE
jgi:two-component system LytT family response regulator